MSLDTRFGAILDSEYCGLYTEVVSDISHSYLELRRYLAQEMGRDVDWLISSSAVRDNFTSPLFHFCVILKLLAKRHSSGQTLPNVIVDSPAFADVVAALYKNLSCTSRIELRPTNTSYFLKALKSITAPVRNTARRLFLWAHVRRNAGRCVLAQASSGEFVRLVDTFLVSEDIREDRYYGGLFEQLAPVHLRQTYLVPTFHNLSRRQISEVLSRAKKDPRQFLFKETCLKISDVLWASGHFWRVRDLKIPPLTWCGVDISPVFREDLKAGAHLEGAFIALLNYRLFRALKDAGREVSETIDWFENQSVDAGWNLGVHTHFPSAKTFGYQGFFQANDGANPTSYEYQLGVIPQKLCVMGPGLREQRARWCPEVEIDVAPAFRFRWLWHTDGSVDQEPTSISESPPILMTVLPADALTANFLLSLIYKISERCSGWRFWIKPHPSLPLAQLKSRSQNAARTEIVSGSLQKLFAARPVVLNGGMTTAGLEALAFGLPAIFCCPSGREHQLPVPDVLKPMALPVCHSEEELVRAIEDIQHTLRTDQAYFSRKSVEIRRELFAPVTLQGVTALGFVN